MKKVLATILSLILVFTIIPATALNVSAATSSTLSINWSHITSVGNQPKGSDACLCYSLAYCRTILDKKVHYWSEYDYNGGTNVYDACGYYSKANYIMANVAGTASVYTEAYNSINNGRPFIVFVSGSRTTWHFITIVGYTNVSNTNNLSASNFLIIDSVQGTPTTAVENMGSVGYSLRKNNGGYYEYYYTNSGSASSTPSSNEKVYFHTMNVSNVSENDATISTWTSNQNGEFFSCGFYFGVNADKMQLFTTYAHKSWTSFFGEYKISDYYGKLSPGKKYYYKYYLISANGMQYYSSETKTLTTNGQEKISFGYESHENETAISSYIKGWAWNKSGLKMNSIGLYIGTDRINVEKIERNKNVSWTDFNLYTNILDYNKALSPNTTYFCRFYINADTTYYSEWIEFKTTSKYPKFTVTLNANGGNCNTTSKTVTYNSKYGALPIPTRDGYSFLGWYTSQNSGTKIVENTTVTILNNQTLYAKWQKNVTTSTDFHTTTHEHVYECIVTKKATYFTAGEEEYVCECGDVYYTLTIPKLKLKTPKFTLKKGKKSFKVTYNKVKDATGFQVRYKLSGKWTVKIFNSKKTVTKTIKKLKKGKKYTVQIRAFKKSGSKNAYSAWAASKKITVK